MSGTAYLQDLPEPYFTQALSHLSAIQNASNRHRLFEALDIGLNYLRELSAREMISPEDAVSLGRFWGDVADKRLRAIPELGGPAPVLPSGKNAQPGPMADDAVQSALEELLELAERDTSQSRRVANFLLAWWNAAENGGFDLADLYGLNRQSASACAVLFGCIAHSGVTPNALGYSPRFKALALKWRS